MKIKSVGMKVSLIVAIMITTILIVINLIVSSQSSALIMDLTKKEAAGSNISFAKQIESLEKEAAATATIIAYSRDVIDAILSGDDDVLREYLLEYGYEVDTVMVTDVNGNVLIRTHSDQKGDNVMNQSIVSSTLSTGIGTSTIARGATVGLATRGSAVIRDHNGNIIGLVVCGHDLSNPKHVDDVKNYTGSEATIFDGSTRLMTTITDDKGDRVVGTNASDAVIAAVINQKGDYGLQINLFGNEYYAYYSPLIIDNEVIGMLFNGVRIDDALAGQRAMATMVLTIGIICGIVCIILVIIYNMLAVGKPLSLLSSFMKKAGETGDLTLCPEDVAIIQKLSNNGDEIGHAISGSASFIAHVTQIAEGLESIADGDLTTSVEVLSESDTLGISLKKMEGNLSSMFGEIRDSSDQVSTGSKQIADGAQSLAHGATEQAASIQELSSSISIIAEKTKENAQTAEQTAKLSETIKESAEKGVRQMDEMITAVGEINDASKNISKIIKTIDDIAFQTNILALNAAVEAARAGQHGKGFAVVAEEVRNLASKSAEAAKDTGGMIQNTMAKAELGSHIAEKTSASLSEIVSGVNEAGNLITEIAMSSEEQSSGISRINIGIDQVAQVVQQNSATAEESAAASEEMSGQADMLQQLISHFKLDEMYSNRQEMIESAVQSSNQLRLANKYIS